MRIVVAALVLLLTSCMPPDVEAPKAPSPEVVEVQGGVAEAIVPAVVSVRETIQEAIQPPTAPEPAEDQADAIAAALIVRWEVTSPAYYSRRLEGVICPGGASGPTWGLGWDGGHQTQRENREAWSQHEHVDRLAVTAGVTGEARCRSTRNGLLDIRVPYAMAESVFIRFALPKYKALAVRKYGVQLLDQPPGVRGSLYSETYNRGGEIRGSRGTEQAFIRDTCLPERDAECVAVQLNAMCRLWRGTPNGPGLCARRADEARAARGES